MMRKNVKTQPKSINALMNTCGNKKILRFPGVFKKETFEIWGIFTDIRVIVFANGGEEI